MTTVSNTLSTTTLPNGLRVAFEHIDAMESASLSWLLPAGSIFDDESTLGCSTVVAEMLMRGTTEMDSRQQADAFDHVGALRNSSAGVRFSSLGLSVVGNRLHEALPLIVDMVRSPRLNDETLNPARELAKQSIASLADEPQRRAVLSARSRHLPSPFNRNTLGTIEGLNAITSEQVANWWQEHAVADGAILSLAGRFDTDATLKQLETLLADWGGKKDQPGSLGTAARGYAHEADDSNQVQIIVLHDGPAVVDDDSVLERIASAVLSGGMSGRLFTEVREKRGLCYSVSSAYSSDRERGVVTSYVGTTPERAQESLDVLIEQLHQINAGDVTGDEFERATIGMKSRLVFAGESTQARAGAGAADIANFGRVRTLEEIVAKIDAVTLDQLNEYLRRRDPGTPTIQTLGPDALTEPS